MQYNQFKILYILMNKILFYFILFYFIYKYELYIVIYIFNYIFIINKIFNNNNNNKGYEWMVWS